MELKVKKNLKMCSILTPSPEAAYDGGSILSTEIQFLFAQSVADGATAGPAASEVGSSGC